MPRVTWHTAAALQRTSGYSLDNPGTRISRSVCSAVGHGAASARHVLITSTLTANGAAGAAAGAATLIVRDAAPTANSMANVTRSSHPRRRMRCRILTIMVRDLDAGDASLWNADCMPVTTSRANSLRRHRFMQHRFWSTLAATALIGLTTLCAAASAPLTVA